MVIVSPTKLQKILNLTRLTTPKGMSQAENQEGNANNWHKSCIYPQKICIFTS